jgi:hypothetical protein
MQKRHVITITVVMLIVSLAQAGPARSEEPAYVWTLGLLGGIGGSFDVDPDTGLGNPGLQLNASMVSGIKTQLGLRVGWLDLGGKDDQLGSLVNAELTYATIAGEYRTHEGLYVSGIFLGVGGYQLKGEGGDGSDSGLGLTAGVNGTFRMNKRWSVLVELQGHYASLDEAQLFGQLLAGVAAHF